MKSSTLISNYAASVLLKVAFEGKLQEHINEHHLDVKVVHKVLDKMIEIISKYPDLN